LETYQGDGKSLRAIDEVPYKFRKNYMRQLKTDYETNFEKLAMGLIKKFNMKFISKKHKLGRVTIPLETQTFSNAKQPDGNFVYMLAGTKIGINKKSCKPV